LSERKSFKALLKDENAVSEEYTSLPANFKRVFLDIFLKKELISNS
jgi:hypothetical protein